MGIIMSLPFPVEVKTGSNAKMVVTVVIKQGRILLLAPSKTANLISFLVVGIFLLESLCEVSCHDHAIVCGNSEQGDETDPNRHT